MFDYVKAVDIAYRNARVRKTQDEVSRLIQVGMEDRSKRGKSTDERAMKKLEAKYAPMIEDAKKVRFNTDLRPTNLIWLDDPSVYSQYGYSRPGWFLIEQDSAPGNYIDGMSIDKYRLELDGYLSAAAAAERAKAKK